jgi:serine/threonine protein kinase
MSEGPHDSVPRSSPLRDIDRIADRFDLQWQISNEPQIREYLEGVPADLRLRLLVELVCTDFEFRVRKGLTVSLDDYFREFPELESLPAADRADLEAHARECRKARAPTIVQRSPEVQTLPDVPTSIGRYAIAGRIGSGGQAEVFLSFHPEFRIPVVIKWGRRKQLALAQRDQIAHEGQILAGLPADPNLVRVYEVGLHDDRPYLVMEQIQGRTLEEFVAAEHVTPRHAAELVAALATAVHTVHQHGVIHQDISLRNVLIDARGQPRLIDFGLSWFQSPWSDPSENTGPIGGTPNCLSPEQADRKLGTVSHKTDVFGLGAILYYLLTGRPLYEAATRQEILELAAQAKFDADALQKKGIPKPLAAACLKALSRNPQDRFSTAAEFAAELKKAIRKPRWPLIAAGVILFLAAGAGGWLLAQSGRPPSNASHSAVASGLTVRVGRSKSGYIPLSQAIPLHNGDDLQVRFEVPPGLHVGLFSVNGDGRLSLLRQYPPQVAPTEFVYPGSGAAVTLEPPVGTEMLLVCGRTEGPMGLEELQKMWDQTAPWKPLNPPSRILHLKNDVVAVEGEKSRDLGPEHARPELEVAGRLEILRERLAPLCSLIEGLAFAHQ